MVDTITSCEAKFALLSHSTAIKAVFTAVGTEQDMSTVCAITPKKPKACINTIANIGPKIKRVKTAIFTLISLKSNLVFES